MAFNVQNDAGSVADANSYLSVEDMQAYHASRGNSLGTATSDQLQQALVRATDHLDGRFTYKGQRLNGPTQATQWPRSCVYDRNGRGVYGIPRAVKEAIAEYALRALSNPLSPDPELSSTGARVQSTSNSVGPLSESVTYAQDGALALPEYPVADNKLRKAELIQSLLSGRVSRG